MERTRSGQQVQVLSPRVQGLPCRIPPDPGRGADLCAGTGFGETGPYSGKRRFKPSIEVLLVVVIAIEVPISAVAVAVVVVGDPAAIAVPVACIVALSIMTRFHPVCICISRAGPVSVMPPIVPANRVPVAPYPGIALTRASRLDPDHARSWRCADSYTNGYLTEDGSRRQ